jgi:RNA polymerase sigma-70 factor (ECF subfamily)
VSQAAEPLSFESIYRASFPFVYQKLWWLGIERRDLDDLAQEVFLVAYRRLPSYDPAFSMNAWLGGITWRVARNHQGRTRKRAEESLPEEAEWPELASPEIGVEQAAAQAERSVRLRGLVQRLDPDLRVIFVMHELEGISMNEIAAALGIPRGTAWSRQRKAVAEFNAAARRLNARSPGALDVSFGLLPWGFAMDLPALAPPARAAEASWTRLQESIAERTSVESKAEAWDLPTPKRAPRADIDAAMGHAGRDLLWAKRKLAAAGAGLLLGGAGAGILADRALHPRHVTVETARP